MAAYQLAQLNIAQMRTPMDSPEMADFVANLDRINALADSAPGFVWRLAGDDGNATAFRPFGEDTLVNLSVWDNVDALGAFVYKTAHVEIMKRRKEWFDRMEQAYMVLWWVPADHRPDEAEAKDRLQTLRTLGPTDKAFTFKQPFPAPL
ncbi:DUF3291 domain-containing protein [Rhodoferax sp. GW822-FHT02A01]|uniref:DUF3291 domain-containing protein n=1 Tax=Rhodoferax sp. GW822-FHT02A01 TaxID=3141537 RepID=UPI00315C52EB